MAPASNEDQFKFLISCIRYSNNGKVDFDLVKDECGIISKGAAAKRYERMMKAHGIHQSQTSTVDNVRATPTPSRPKASPAAGSSKKRKHNQLDEANLNTDDDEGLPLVKAEGSGSKVKAERSSSKAKTERPSTKVKTEQAKEEADGSEPFNDKVKEEFGETSDPPDEKATPGTITLQPDNPEKSLFDDFLAFGASAIQDYGVPLAIGGGPSHDSLAGLTPIPSSSGGQDAQESILIAD